MPRFFLSKNHIARFDREIDGVLGTIVIDGGDARHIALSLRMHTGDAVTVCDMQKIEYRCTIADIEKLSSGRDSAWRVRLDIREIRQSDTEPSYSAWLYQAIPKGDKLDFIVQKAVETGVAGIVLFLSERCISRPDAATVAHKCERLQKIAEEAAKQSGRGIIPPVLPPVSYDEAVAMASRADLGFLCYEGDGTLPMGKLIAERRTIPSTVHFLIGPEGGFSVAEVAKARNSGLASVGLGKRILRTETASGFVLSCLTYAYDLQ